MIVLGIGTGRCGTKSLAGFLDRQPNSEVSHEFGQQLRWDESDLDFFEKRLEIWTLDEDIRGDVALWYLPYIEKLVREEIYQNGVFSFQLHDIVNKFRVVCLRRDRDTVVRSFIKHQNSGNTFQEKGGSWPEVDRAFPTYPDELSQEEAISEYWRYYYESAEWISDIVDWFKIFELEELSNSRAKEDELLDFLEFSEEGRKYGFPHENRRKG